MTNSYRAILRSTSIMGVASVVNILSGLVRMKAAAVLLGPAGVGLFGIYQNLVSTAATVSALGFGTAGTRLIADTHVNGSAVEVSSARRALFWGTLILALLGAAVFFLLRDRIAARVLADPLRAYEVGWLALGVALTVMAGSQTAFLNGLRRIGDLARIQVAAGLSATLLALGALFFWRDGAILVLVLVAPATTFGLGHWYVSRLGRISTGPTPLTILVKQWQSMARLGVALMVSALVTGLGHLAVRTLVQQELGLDALGQFQAAWTIGMIYLTFVLGAMATDYYPRLAACIEDQVAACRLINQQTEIALLLAGPVIISLMGLAPWVIRLLYSAEFAPAADVLRWQLLGDIFKVLSWSIGYGLFAMGAGKSLVLTETVASCVFVFGVALGMPYLGLTTTGVAFLAMYMVHLPLVFYVAWRKIGFIWSRTVALQAGGLLAAGITVTGLGYMSNLVSGAFGLTLSVMLGVYAVLRLSAMAGINGRLGRLTGASRRMSKWLRIKDASNS